MVCHNAHTSAFCKRKKGKRKSAFPSARSFNHNNNNDDALALLVLNTICFFFQGSITAIITSPHRGASATVERPAVGHVWGYNIKVTATI